MVMVRVEDGQGGSNTIEVTINLADEQEPPGDPAAPNVVPASSTSLTVSWEEPTNTGPDIDDYDVQYREGDSGGFTSWSHNSTDRTATITDLTPDTTYQAQVQARNDEGTSDWSPPGTGSTGANQRPVFTDGSSATRRLDENTEGVQYIGDPITATDPEGTTLTYSLEGADADSFTIVPGSGQLRTDQDATYDYETKSSYFVMVKATDGHGDSSIIPVSINLNDINEPPAFTGEAAFEVAENVQLVGTVVARDEDSADGITNYTITGGTDRDRFELINTNDLRLKDVPDFENPTDAGRNNEYSVTVTATGGTGARELTTTQAITVTVENVDEPPGKPDPPTVSDETENSLTVSWTEPANTGPTITNYFVQYRDSGAFTDWPDSSLTRTRIITGLSSGTTYQIQVQAKNAEGKGPWSNSASGTTLTAPTVSSVAFTSTPASAQNSTYKLGDVIEVTATFSEAVTVTGTPQIDLTISFLGIPSKADYKRGSTTSALVFEYTVQAGDNDINGADINENGLKLNGGSIRKNNSTIDADLAHGALTNQSGHKVDGVVPTLTDAKVKDDLLTLTYGEVLDSSPKPATGDFAVTADGTAQSVTEVGVSGSEVMLTLDPAVTLGQTVTLTYTPGTNPIRDLAQNPAASLTNRTVPHLPMVSVCDRTTQVRDAIVAKAPVSTCGDVTAEHLAAIIGLKLISKNITVLKAGDFSGLTALETLYLRSNKLTTLPENVFSGLTALETLYLHKNQLTTLPENVFSGLTALKYLYLNENQLTTLPENVFSGLTALERLYLHKNQLTTLPENVFSGLTALKYLYLNENQLTTLPENVFSGLTALKYLYLNENQLTTLPENVFSGLTALNISLPK